MALAPPEFLLTLANHCAVGALVCAAVADGRLSGVTEIRRICTIAGIAQARGAEVQEFLEAGAKLGLLARKTQLTWEVLNPKALAVLAPQLEAIRIYRTQIHREADTVSVVLSKPPEPSQLADALRKSLQGTWGLANTRDLLPMIAERAHSRLAIMTPYLDEVGAEIVLALFKNALPDVRKQLVIRLTPEGALPPGLGVIADGLKQLGVCVYNFRLDRPGTEGYETFHAKVVLADNASAYVGSANMNKWSFQYSLELGLMVSGQAAVRIAQVLDAVIQVSAGVDI